MVKKYIFTRWGASLKKNLVSIITPTFNSDEFISEAIESVQRQTYENWEMLIVDDASSDGTCKIVDEFAKNDERIKLMKQLENGGAAVARNVAISEANGRFIAFLDSDDIWQDEKLERQLALFKKTNAPLIYSGYEKIDQYGARKGRIVTVPERINYAGLLNATVIATVTAVYDTRCVGRVLMPNIRKRQDYALWLKILRMGGEACAVMEPLAYLRKRPGSVSSNKISAAKYVWKVYRDVEKLPISASLFHFSHYAYRAFLKSRL